jgi:anti-sigma factor RsiW
MKIDEPTLRAYVDGELSPLARTQVEAVLANHEDWRQQADALRASRLPYRAAFDAQHLPPVPEKLQAHVANLTAAAFSGDPARRPGRWSLNFNWLAAGTFALASFIAGTMVAVSWPEFGRKNEQIPSWVHAIANYQAMYVRETVGRSPDSAEYVKSVLRTLKASRSPRDVALTVPDLSSVGLEFKRIQMLGIEGKPLTQIAYLPERGKPAALCVLKLNSSPDAEITAKRMENLSIVSWQKDGYGYVLAVDLPVDQALTIGKKIDAHAYPALYSP